jgi:two-component system chemotaxis response regulator CheB
MNHDPTSRVFRALVIGGSAGALGAMLRFLPLLPRDFPLPVMIVVHLPPDGESLLAPLLNSRCQLSVKEAEDKEPISPGVVYIAPPNYHLLVEPDFLLSLSQDDCVLYSRPSIDVLFESAADAYGDALAGIILTGASSDGAAGLKALVDAGGSAYVQDPATAEASAMPEAALAACPNAQIVDLADVAALLQRELVSAPS